MNLITRLVNYFIVFLAATFSTIPARQLVEIARFLTGPGPSRLVLVADVIYLIWITIAAAICIYCLGAMAKMIWGNYSLLIAPAFAFPTVFGMGVYWATQDIRISFAVLFLIGIVIFFFGTLITEE